MPSLDTTCFLRSFSFLTMIATLSACGGGGGTPIYATGGTKKGYFLDNAVSGLQYESNSKSGITGNDGSFEYVSGETVRFYLGGIEIGSTLGAKFVTPLTLVGNDADTNNQNVINLLRFLQTLDNDGNLANGIQITQSVRDAAVSLSVNFDTPVADFELDADTISALSALTTLTEAGNRILIDEDSAKEHFATTLIDIELRGTLPSSGGTKITEEEAFQLLTDSGTGIWRYVVELGFSTQSHFGNTTQTLETQSSVSSTLAFRKDNTGYEVDNCSLETFEPVEIGDVTDNSEDFDDDGFCQSDQNQQDTYFRINDNSIRVEYTCNGDAIATALFTKLSNNDSFSQGSLSFNANQIDDLNTTSAVCGSSSAVTLTSDTEPDSSAFPDGTTETWTLSAVAPYQNDHKIALNIQFSGGRRTGTYTIGSFSNELTASDKIASLKLLSADFGGTVSIPNTVSATTGSVTIKTISAFTITGSFDVMTSTGDNITGEFSVDMSD